MTDNQLLPIHPIHRGRERGEADGVVVLAGVMRVPELEVGGLQLLEQRGEILRRAGDVVAVDVGLVAGGEVEADGRGKVLQFFPGEAEEHALVPVGGGAGRDDALEEAGALDERVEREESAEGMPEQAAVGGVRAVGAFDERDDILLDEREERGGATGPVDGGVLHRRRREIERAERHGVAAGLVTDVDHDDRPHALRVDVVVLEERQQREMPAVEHVEHGIGLAGGGVVLGQRDEEHVVLAGLRGAERDALGVRERDGGPRGIGGDKTGAERECKGKEQGGDAHGGWRGHLLQGGTTRFMRA